MIATIIATILIALTLLLGGCGESASERGANQTTEHRLRSLEERVTALEKR